MKTARSTNSKAGPGGATKRGGERRIVHFEYNSAGARKVCIAGSFNDWKPEYGEMIRTSEGNWVKDMALKPGTYEYRLVVDNRWIPDPNADHAVMNPYGERNSLLTVDDDH